LQFSASKLTRLILSSARWMTRHQSGSWNSGPAPLQAGRSFPPGRIIAGPSSTTTSRPPSGRASLLPAPPRPPEQDFAAVAGCRVDLARREQAGRHVMKAAVR
jgi:hypothetical protein